jgi:hypothetical protein
VKYEVPLPFATGFFVGVGEYVDVDPNTGDVFVSGHDAAVQGNHAIFRVTPSTGHLTQLATIGSFLCLELFILCYSHSLFWVFCFQVMWISSVRLF